MIFFILDCLYLYAGNTYSTFLYHSIIAKKNQSISIIFFTLLPDVPFLGRKKALTSYQRSQGNDRFRTAAQANFTKPCRPHELSPSRHPDQPLSFSVWHIFFGIKRSGRSFKRNPLFPCNLGGQSRISSLFSIQAGCRQF